MNILWTNHPTTPSLNGTEQDVPRSIAEGACYYKQAEIVPPAQRGSKGNKWLAERLAQSAAVTTPDAHDTPARFFDQPVWSVSEKASGTVYVEKSFKSETTRFEAPPADASPAIVAQFNELKNVDPAASALAYDAAVRAQIDYDNKVQNAKRW
jgi:hypothetical protein